MRSPIQGGNTKPRSRKRSQPTLNKGLAVALLLSEAIPQQVRLPLLRLPAQGRSPRRLAWAWRWLWRMQGGGLSALQFWAFPRAANVYPESAHQYTATLGRCLLAKRNSVIAIAFYSLKLYYPSKKLRWKGAESNTQQLS
ncbi:MAG: hypothetical protein HC852_02825 [Acaryochloridaceae cyanobacterium RU_4_10]|nr:hypothetical protein [Acaryochloridaceae cyanobacterium RU_4_10]